MIGAYAWIKDTKSNADQCILDENICVYNSIGHPVRYCSFQRNQDTQVCKNQRSLETRSAYRILGCYSSADCGGNVGLFGERFTCPPQELKKCGHGVPLSDRRKNCKELEEGTIESSSTDQNYTKPRFCYLGKRDSEGYDPCGVSIYNGGIDLIPNSCFHYGCCPGSFGNTTK